MPVTLREHLSSSPPWAPAIAAATAGASLGACAFRLLSVPLGLWMLGHAPVGPP